MTTRPRGRPRSFDTDQALDAAAEVFWTRGLEATSLDELCAAMGIARPSLYAAFGDKEALYLAASRRFRDRVADDYRAAVVGAASTRAGLAAYFRALIVRYTAAGLGRGCLVITTAVAAAPTHPAIRAWLAGVLADLDAAFAGTLRRARDAGELPADADLATLGHLLAATQHTLAIRARAGATAAALERLADATLDLVFGPRPAKRRRR